jgi:twinkle protein
LFNSHNCGFHGTAAVYEKQKKDYIKPPPRLEKLSPKIIDWFEKERKISNNTLLRFGITEGKEWMPPFEKEMPVICFNYYRAGELINVKFRGPQKSFKMVKDAELIFYNIDCLKDEKECVIVEGEIDCMSFYEASIYNAVSVPNGANKGNQKLEYFDNCWQYFDDKEKIFIAVDNDEAGQSLKEELCRRLGKDRCYIVSYPEACKDANEVLIKHGKAAVKSLVEAAVQYPLEGIISVDDVYSQVENYYQNGYPMGIKTNIPGFDELLRFCEQQLTIITGIPGSGKDEFLNYIVTQLVDLHQWKFAICGFEEPAAFTITKLQEKLIHKSFAFRKDVSNRINEQEFNISIDIVRDYFRFINIEQVGAQLDDILSKAVQLVKRFGIKGLIINPWNCLEHKRPEYQSETEYVSESMTKILNFCFRYNVHVFLIAHTTKMQKNPHTKKYEIPTLYNISGSAHFFNKTHNGICICRDFETNVTDVYVQKVKQSWLGRIGFCSFNFNQETREYLPIL